jgi:hypothetical protein
MLIRAELAVLLASIVAEADSVFIQMQLFFPIGREPNRLERGKCNEGHPECH